MRIISGKNKGKRLVAPQRLPVRPTTDFAKESLFNILNNYYYLDVISVLDLFCGTGNISYEFASRGCEDIVSVDVHSGCIQYVRKISQELDFPIRVHKSDVYAYLQSETRSFDVIFADPPYDFSLDQLEQLVHLCKSRNLLSEGGTLIIEHSHHLEMSNSLGFSFEKRYGGTVFSFFQQEEND